MSRTKRNPRPRKAALASSRVIVLALTTAPPDPITIAIDGVSYALVPIETRPAGLVHAQIRDWQTVEALATRHDLEPAQTRALVAALDRIVAAALPELPTAIAGRLSENHRVAIARVYLKRGGYLASL